MECPHCHQEINDKDSFCPYCGAAVSHDDRELHCPYCHAIIHREDDICPNCHRKLKFSDRLNKDNKAGFTAFLIMAISYAFMFMPIAAIVGCLAAIILGFPQKEKNRYGKDAFVFGIVGLSLAVCLMVTNVAVNFNTIKDSIEQMFFDCLFLF